MFVTKFVTLITKFVICVSKFVIHVTKFVTKTILYEPKNYLADNENYLADSKNYLAESGARNGLCRAQPNFRASECRGQASLVLCRAADKGAFYIDQLVELCVKCQLQ